MTEHDAFWEKEFLKFSQMPEEEVEEAEQVEGPVLGRLLTIVIGLILAGIAFFLPLSYLVIQGLLVWPLSIIFVAMGALGSLFIFLACYTRPIEEIY